ncbi:MAG: SOS response-associated peptidase [Gammaproteobacteria bacterium]|nr:MAG: SOS response-associated peptidase [Gammaproteobacteria bacterium]
MCGRFANHVKDMGRWAEVLGDWPTDVQTSYNIAPDADIAAFTVEGGTSMRWGLVPAWSKTPSTKYSTFNARAESLASRPAFRGAWKHDQRCLIPVQGYYEWQRVNGKKQPFYISSPGGEPLVCAGLWDQWGEGREQFRSCAMITCPAIRSISAIHPRMPLLMELEYADLWLQGEAGKCAGILQREPEAELSYYRVSQLVNNSRNQGADILTPVED